MEYSTLPQTNLKAEDIRDTLNANGGSVGNNTTTFFSDAANINMFSRYKPIRNNALFINLWENDAWKGTDGQCGIDFTGATTNNYREVVGAVTNDGNNGWLYQRPWVGITKPYRLGDFRGYMANALPPTHSFSVTPKVAERGILNADIAYNVSSQSPDGTYMPGSIGLDDFSYNGKSLGQWHFGIVVTDSSNNVKGRSFSGGGMSSCTFNVSSLYKGSTYKAWPLLAMEEMGQTETDKMNTYLFLPNCGPQEFKVVSPEEALGIKIYLTCEYLYLNGNKTSIKYKVTVSIENGSITLTNNWLQMRFSTSDIMDAMQIGEKREKLPDISISKNSPYVKEGVFTIDTVYQEKNYYLYGTFHSSTYTTNKVYPMEEMQP